MCVVVASEMTVRAFLVRQLRAMQSEYDLTVVVNTANTNLLHELGIDGRLAAIAIERRISIPRDLAALWSLYRLLRNSRFDLVHSITPKAGLLAMAAAWMARVPVRIHTFTGPGVGGPPWSSPLVSAAVRCADCQDGHGHAG